MPKITNKAAGPVSVYVGGVSMAVAPGEFIESDGFTDAELKFYGAHPDQFDVSGKAVENDDLARKALQDIADMFGTPDIDYLNVKAAIERLIQDQAPAIDTSTGASDLASAVALLDDANDDHWTQAGKPKISVLKTLTDKEITAADYDALPDSDKRERKV